jgi:hypothetical protein
MKTDKQNSAKRQFPRYVYIVSIVILVFIFANRWLDKGLPGEDFPGNVGWLWEIKQNICEGKDLSSWTGYWFNGCSRTLIHTKFLGFLIPLIFSFLGEIAAIKFSLVLFHILSGIGMFYFIEYLVKDRDAAFLGAICYCLNPVYLLETAQHGHMEVSLFYVFLPVVFGLFIKTLIKKSIPLAILTGFSVFLSFWTDNEGFFVTMPFLGVIWLAVVVSDPIFKGKSNSKKKNRVTSSQIYKKIREYVVPVFIAVIIFLGLGAFVIIPAWLERTFHNLFPEEYLQRSMMEFSFANPLYLIDRNGIILSKLQSLPPPMRLFSGQLYPGIIALCLILMGVAGSKDGFKRIYSAFWFILIAAFLLSFGGISPWESLQMISGDPIFLSKLAIVAMIAMPIITALIILWMGKVSGFILAWKKPIVIGLLLLPVILLLKPFVILRKTVFLYSHMRCPLWFYITPFIFVFSFLASMGVLYVRQKTKGKHFLKIYAVLVVLVIIDFLPYKKPFEEQLTSNNFKEVQEVYREIGKDRDFGRIISCETYVPLHSYGCTVAAKPSGWDWLNWIAPRNMARYIFEELYKRLWAEDEGMREEGALLAGLANIKYIVDDKAEMPDLPPCESIPLFFETDRFRVFRNEVVMPYLQLYPSSALYIGPISNEFFRLLQYLVIRGVGVCSIERYNGEDVSSYDFVFWNQEEQDSLLLTYARMSEMSSPPRVFDMVKKESIIMPEFETVRAGVAIKRVSQGEIRVNVTPQDSLTSAPHLVVLSESYYPYWHAYVNGVEQPVHTAFSAFTGVNLGENGPAEIVFRFERPWQAKLGILISLIFAFSTGIFLIYIGWTKYRERIARILPKKPLAEDAHDSSTD